MGLSAKAPGTAAGSPAARSRDPAASAKAVRVKKELGFGVMATRKEKGRRRPFGQRRLGKNYLMSACAAFTSSRE